MWAWPGCSRKTVLLTMATIALSTAALLRAGFPAGCWFGLTHYMFELVCFPPSLPPPSLPDSSLRSKQQKHILENLRNKEICWKDDPGYRGEENRKNKWNPVLGTA